MADEPGESTGPNARPLDDTVAETGPGLSDDAVAEGELAPGELEKGAEAELERLRRLGWTTPSDASSQPPNKG